MDEENIVYPVGKVTEAFLRAREKAYSTESDNITTEHVLLGLLEGNGLRKVLTKLEKDHNKIRGFVYLKHLTDVEDPKGNARGLEYTPRLRDLLENSVEEAMLLRRSRLDPECLLLGILRDKASRTYQWLNGEFGITYSEVDKAIRERD